MARNVSVVSQQCAQRRPATPRPLTRAPTNHQQVVMSAEDAARRAWLAKQDQPITSAARAKAAWLGLVGQACNIGLSFCYHDLPWLEAYVEGACRSSACPSATPPSTPSSKCQQPAAAAAEAQSGGSHVEPERGGADQRGTWAAATIR